MVAGSGPKAHPAGYPTSVRWKNRGHDPGAFCTTNGTVPIDGWVNASRTVVTRALPGVNTVRVLARTIAGGGPTRIDDLSVDVEN